MRGWAAAALVVAALTDSLTFIAMGTAHELNPIAANFPGPAVAAKAALVVLILAAPLQRYRLPVMAFGAFAWTVGALSNLLVLVR